jgi:hypothetical protein
MRRWPEWPEAARRVVANGRFGYDYRRIGRIFAALLGRHGGPIGA